MIKAQQAFVIDGQVFQTDAWHRGMGKYSLALLSALKNSGLFDKHGTLVVVFNKNLPVSSEVKQALGAVLDDPEFMFIDLMTPVARAEFKATQDRNREKLTAELEGVKELTYFIPALFIDEACIVFPANASSKLLLFYDLIPLLYHQRYIGRINFQNYLSHFSTIFEADKVFTISQTVANDCAVYLGLRQDKLINIDGAPIGRSNLSVTKPKLPFSNKFILMPTGDEIRKNNTNAVKGFERFNQEHDNQFKLVITSRIGSHTKESLKRLSDNIHFTGNVPEDELQWLYENAELVLFPPEYEGLGLPILEAVSVGKKVVCSDIPVFREISPDALYFFDTLDTSSLAEALKRAAEGYQWGKKRKLYDQIIQEYSWENTAQKFSAGLVSQSVKSAGKKPKIAILCPDPAGYSAIGKVVAETHDSLSDLFDVHYYFDRGVYHREVRPDFLSHIATCFRASEFNARRYREYDAVIYHIGNSDYHLNTIKSALHLPGYVVLHDTFLSGAFEGLRQRGYMSPARLDAEKLLDRLHPQNTSQFLNSIVNNQLGVIVHSQYAAEAVRPLVPKGMGRWIRVLNLPVATPDSRPGDSRVAFQIGLAGIIADVKGLTIIEDIASRSEFNDSVINIFGHNFAKPEIIRQFSKWTNVKIHTNPTDFEFQNKLAALDVLINYRLEYKGETSLTTLEAMRYGVPVIVRGDAGWYSELPDSAVVKVGSPEDVPQAVMDINRNGDLRSEKQIKAIALTANRFTHGQYAEGIRTLHEEIMKAKTKSSVYNRAITIRQSSNLDELPARLFDER